MTTEIITRTFKEKKITIDTEKGSFSWLEIKEGTATYRHTKKACQEWLEIVYQNPFCETIFKWE